MYLVFWASTMLILLSQYTTGKDNSTQDKHEPAPVISSEGGTNQRVYSNTSVTVNPRSLGERSIFVMKLNGTRVK